MSSDLLAAIGGDAPMAATGRGAFVNPLVGSYRTKDGRHIQLVFLEADRYWAEFCRLLGRDDLVDDPRFVTMHVRRENAAACNAPSRCWIWSSIALNPSINWPSSSGPYRRSVDRPMN